MSTSRRALGVAAAIGLAALYVVACTAFAGGSTGSDGNDPKSDAGSEAGTFSITVGASNFVLRQGGTINVPFDVTNAADAGPVDVSIAALPAYLSAPVLALGDASSGTMPIQAAANATPGTYPVSLVATSSGASVSATFELVVAPPAGTLDSTFGQGGIVRSSAFEGAGFTVAADGSIIIAGCSPAPGSARLARLTISGAPDESFGPGGIQAVPITTQSCFVAASAAADGTITALGYDDVSEYTLARVLPNGGRDPSFGDGGSIDPGFALVSPAVGAALLVRADGTIIGVGETSGHPTIARVLATGASDPTFGSGGAVTAAGITGSFAALVQQPDGRIVAAGAVQTGIRTSVGVQRYTSAGALDLTFGDAGTVVTDFAGVVAVTVRGVVLLPGGDLLVGGFGGAPSSATDLARYTASGAPSQDFGTGGHTQILSAEAVAAYGLAIAPDGNVVLAGIASGSGALVVARVDPSSGALDPTFAGGAVYVSGTSNTATADVRVAPDGKIVAFGHLYNPPGWVVARYWP